MSRKIYVAGILSIVMCAILLVDARALFAPYLVAAIYALYCLSKLASPGAKTSDERVGVKRFIFIVSIVSGVFLMLANHKLWNSPALPDVAGSIFVRLFKAAVIVILVAGGFFTVKFILSHLVYDRTSFCVKTSPRQKCLLFFLIPFGIFLVIYLSVYYCCYYPALLSVDTIDQVDQIFSGVYSNHQPFYHTIMIGALIRCGLMVFGSVNPAVAVAAVFQIVFMAAVFAFAVYNIARLNLPAWMCVCSCIWYALMPFHIMYSFTLWKDVYFGAFTTYLIIFMIRIMTDTGKKVPNYIGFAVCSLFICLIRSNGLFSYVFVLLAILLLARKYTKLIFIMLFVIVSSFLLKHTLLSVLGVTQPDTVEALSMPLQQIARVYADGGNVSAKDEDLLSDIIDVSAIEKEYDSNISDPIKDLIRDYGNEDYLTENKGKYALVYLRTFLRNPLTYVLAWVDSTCGYWNSGYNYWVWYWDIEGNDHGIERTIHCAPMLRFMDEYLWCFYNSRILQLFTAIGLFVWILSAVFVVDICDNNRTGIITAVPILSILLSLLISSPVFSEFRYMYPLFCALPVIIAVSLRKAG